jgi:hypothetical protein
VDFSQRPVAAYDVDVICGLHHCLNFSLALLLALDVDGGAAITLRLKQELLSDEVVARRDSDVNPVVVRIRLEGV